MKFRSVTILRSVRIACVLLLVGAGTHCIGQNSKPYLSEASLDQLGNIPVYSASMHLQPSGDAPSSAAAITAAEIQEQGYRTLADILRTVRSFYVTDDRNYSGLGVRGFERPGNYNARILLLVDGHGMNDGVATLAIAMITLLLAFFSPPACSG